MRGFKLNNPGNLRKSDNAWKGKIASDDAEFEQFGTIEDGLRAMMLNIKNKKELHGIETLADMISNYAPPSENDTDGYIQFVADRTGIDPRAPIDLADKSLLVPITKAMVEMEQGKPDIIDDTTFDAAANRLDNTDEDFGSGDEDFDFGNDDEDFTPPPMNNGVRPETQQHIDGLMGQYGPDEILLVAERQKASGMTHPDGQPLWTDSEIDYLKNMNGGAASPPGMLDDEPPKMNALETFGRQTLQGATAGFEDEITDRIGAGIASFVTGMPYDDFLAEGRVSSAEDLKQDWEQNPIASFGGNAVGAITSGAGLAKGVQAIPKIGPVITNAATALAKASPLTASALAGGSGNAVYTAGTAEGDASDRVDDALGGILPGMAGGVIGGAVVPRMVKAGSNLINSGAEYLGGKMPKIFSGLLDDPAEALAAKAAQADPIGTGMSMVDDQALANLQEGKVLRMTVGDKTQNPAIQAMEDEALRKGNPQVVQARSMQQDDAYSAFERSLGGGMLGTPDDLAAAGVNDIAQASKAADIIRTQYDSLGNEVSAAYKKADELGGLHIPTDRLGMNDAGSGLMDRLQTTLAVEGVTAKQMPDLHGAVEDLQAIITSAEKNKQPASTLRELEAWKKNSLNRIDPEKQPIKPAEAKRILSQINNQYEGFLDTFADDAIIAGDDAAINAFREARGLAKKKFSFYEADKSIARIIDERELNGKMLADMVYGAGKLAGKGEDGRIVQRMLELAGPKQYEMQEALKRGMMARVLERSMTSMEDAVKKSQGVQRYNLSFAKMTDNLSELVNRQPEAFKAVFSETEQDYLKQLLKEARSLGSKQSGAVNSSNSWIGLARFINKIPLVGQNPIASGFSQLATIHAEQVIRGKVSKNMEEFIPKVINEIDAPAVFYGGYVGGPGTRGLFPSYEEQE